MLTQAQTEKLIERVTDLLANDPQFKDALPIAEVARPMLEPGLGLAEVIAILCEGYADRPALAQRATELVHQNGRSSRRLLPHFVTTSYAELWERVNSVAAALRESVAPGSRIATIGFPSADYATVDMAVPLLGATAVPLHAGAPEAQLQAMVDEAEPTVFACSVDELGVAARLALHTRSVVEIVVFDHRVDDDDHVDALDAARRHLAPASDRVALRTLVDVIERGRVLDRLPVPQSDPERLAAIIYTSGSSGTPKGAMHPDRVVRGVWCNVAAAFIERNFAAPAITINYLPMSHTGGRAMLYSGLGAGGTAYFTGSSDLSLLLDDVALVRPTQLNFVPRVWGMLHEEFTRRVAQADTRRKQAEVEAEVLADLRSNVLGGRYITALTGSAPIGAELAAWVERLLDWHLMDALGATESGAVVVDGQIQRPPVTDYKLADVPELGYHRTDRPHPRGELLIKSNTLFQGYYRRDDLTAEVFDEEGYYRTGDVVAELSADHVRYIDRRNSVIKLSQGEYVALSKLEATYENAPSVRQIYVYGNSERPYLVAVVVPTEDALDGSTIEDIRSTVLRSLQETARTAGLQSFEVPRGVIVEPSPFTQENGLLTGARKPSRPNLKERYGVRLEALYEDNSRAQDDRWRELATGVGNRSTVTTVCLAAGAVLASTDEPIASERFVDLGGDSLSALTYASTLSDLFDVEVAVDVLINPVNDLQAIADHIDALLGGHSGVPTFATVHGPNAKQVAAADLMLERFIDERTLALARSLDPPAAIHKHVLITGATGYLGRFLTLEWMRRMVHTDGTVTVLVRAADNHAARLRLDDGFDSGDEALSAEYRALASDHLVVLAGDKSRLRFGLDEAAWSDLAASIDLIVDAAALVNHMLPYAQLFGPNVVGTAEVIRLALTTRLKPLAHVSSAALVATIPGGAPEDADVRVISPTRRIDDYYASGYATSKWAGEVLLREAHDRFRLPVRVFRCDMLMADPTHRGQINLPDMVTRLILSVAATGLAPRSFHPDDQGARAHFDGLPVDFVARSIYALSDGQAEGYETFHVLNPHDDGIGLDQYIDWMSEAGCRIERITDYDEWYARFESAVRNLPERARQASILPIIATYRNQQPAAHGAFAPVDCFEKALAGLEGDVERTIPHVDRDVIVKYVTDLEHLGFLQAEDRVIIHDH